MSNKVSFRKESRLYIRMPAELKAHLWMMSHRMGYNTLTDYVRSLIARGLAEDLKAIPAIYLRARPRARVFRLERDMFIPLAECQGGERIWVLGNYGEGPPSLGKGMYYIADITAGNVDGGLEGRDVLIGLDDCS